MERRIVTIRRVSTRFRVVALTAAAAFVPGVASAAAPWSAPTTLSTVGTEAPSPPVVRADGSGALTAVWIERRLDPVTDAWVQTVNTATKQPGGTWSATRVIATPYSPNALTLSVSASGHAIVSWLDRRSYRGQPLQVMTRTPAGAWSTPLDVQPPSTVAAEGFTNAAAFGIGPDGAAFGVWARTFQENLHGTILARETAEVDRSPGGGWSEARPLPAVGSSFDLGIDDAGDATLLFRTAEGGLAVLTRPAGGTWSAITTVAGGAVPAGPGEGAPMGSPTDATLAVGADGSATAAWSRIVGDELRVEASRRAPAGGWSPVETLAVGATVTPIDGLQVDVDAQGRSRAIWRSLTSADRTYTSRVVSTTAPAAGAWAAPVTISGALATHFDAGTTGVVPVHGDLTLDAAGPGEAVAAWTTPTFDAATSSTTAEPVEAVVARAGGAFGTPAVVASAGAAGIDGADVVVDAAGNASVLWAEQGKVKASDSAVTVPAPQSSAKVSVKLTPFFVPTCPAKADAWTGSGRTTLAVARTTTGALRCVATGTIKVKAGTRAGTAFPVLVTGWGLMPALLMARVQ